MIVLLVDDHAIVRNGLALLLQDFFEIEYIIQADTGRDAIQKAYEYNFDIVLIDLTLPDGFDGFDTLRELRTILPDAKLVIFSMHDDISYQKKAYQLGADGYMIKNFNGDQLMTSLKNIMEGKKIFDQKEIESDWVKNEKETFELPISQREKEVFILTVLGHTQKEIAEKMKISIKTVESHRRHINNKLGIKTRTEWVNLAKKYKLVSFPD